MRELFVTGAVKASAIISGDEIHAGIDVDDAADTGPIKNGLVLTFESAEALGEALRSGRVEFAWGCGDPPTERDD